MIELYAALIIRIKDRTIDSVEDDLKEEVIKVLNAKGYDQNGNPLVTQ